MPRRRAPTLLCLLLSACLDSLAKEDALYLAERASAATRPAYPLVGPSLRLGMDSGQVARHLDSLRRRDELDWRLKAGQLPTTVEPHYDSLGHLVRLLVEANATPGGLAHLELRRGLRVALGGEGLPHGRATGDGSLSWFRGGKEIELHPWQELALLEGDLHRPASHAGADPAAA